MTALVTPTRGRVGNTFAALGDSITQGNYGGNAGSGDAWPLYAELVSGGRIVCTGNYGVGGQRTDQYISRLPAILATKPAFVAVLGGSNDIGQLVQSGNSDLQVVGSTIRNLTHIYRLIERAGSVPILITIPPNNGIGNTAAQRLQRKVCAIKLNEWIRRHALVNGWPLVDFYGPLVDDGTSNVNGQIAGNYKASATYTADGTHPSAKGYGVLGAAFWNAIAPLVPPVTAPVQSVDTVDLTQTVDNLFSTPLFFSSTLRPGIPDSWFPYGAAISNSQGVTYSMATDANVLGQAQQLDFTSTATSSGGITNNGPSIPAGHVLQVFGMFSTDGGGSVSVQLQQNYIGIWKPMSISAGTPITRGAYFREMVWPGGILSAVLNVVPVSGSTASARFWYPKVLDLTAAFGITTPLTAN
jgi:lysophospholipase L1-like esterase